MRRALLMLTAMMAALVLGSAVALAATKVDPNGNDTRQDAAPTTIDFNDPFPAPFNFVPQTTGDPFYSEDGMTLTTNNGHYHMFAEDPNLNWPPTQTPDDAPKYLMPHASGSVVRMTYDPNGDGIPDRFDLLGLDVRSGALKVHAEIDNSGVNGAVFGPLGEGSWSLTGPGNTGLLFVDFNVCLDGCTNGGIDNIVFEPATGPANDNFDNAQEISGSTASINGTNVGATREPGEPNFTGSDNGSVWYRWTAPSSGSVEINTCTSNYDTVLGVYTGSTLGSLTTKAENDDTSGCGTNGRGSKVTFPAQANTTYRIYVSGFSSSQGDFTLRLIERKRPQVTSVTPPNNATGVAPGINVTATFSEAMQASTINTTTFKLRKQGTTTFRPAAVTYNSASKKATLNPNANLASGATYVATVTSGAKDLAGNSLDQSPATTGNQSKIWSFKVRR